LKTAATGVYGGAYSPNYVGYPGKTYTISGYIKSDGTCQAYIQIRFLDSTGTYLDSAQTAVSTQTSWHFVTATSVAPANTVYTQLGLPNANPSGAGICEFDNIFATGDVISDEGFSYSARGEPTDVYEFSPHSGGYYHTTAAYWANGALQNLWMSGLPSVSYGVEGEGRPSTVSASSGQNPVTAVTYTTSGTAQPIGSLTNVTFGSGDSGNYTYDVNTGRMKQYKYSVNTNLEIGNLGWNANGSLASLGITDPFNASDAQTCTYTHDDLSRIHGAHCGTVWSQDFTYDAFGNISKSGSSSYLPTYRTANNQIQSVGGVNVSYDANGNILRDGFHTYTWDAEGKMLSIDSTTLTYDALKRMTEQNQAGTYFQVVYSPMGEKLAMMKAQVIQQAFVPLPGSATAEYLSWGLSHYRHPDWLGSSRLESSTTHTILQDTAYAPFGEPYSELSGGNGEISFTGQNKDTAWLNYDFLYREQDPRAGRWISPDPAGLSAADPTNPQTWNRYAYVLNNPLRYIDPLGLKCDFGFEDECKPGGPGGGGGPIFCDPNIDPACIPPPIAPPGGPGNDGGGGGSGSAGGAPSSNKGGNQGSWTDNETLGLPRGLKLHPATLADLLGLSPGTQCDFGVVCNPIGSGFVGPGAVVGGTIICQIAEPCGAVEDAALLVGLLVTAALVLHHAQTQAQPAPNTNWELCTLKLDQPREGGSGFHNCWYQCPKGVIKRVQKGWCDPYIQSF
jgi:RHS repeat-associated protein